MTRSTPKQPPDRRKLDKLLADYAAAGGDLSILQADGKNAAAVALGRKGGLKGGKARAERLSPDERKSIALRAANARWGHRSNTGSNDD